MAKIMFFIKMAILALVWCPTHLGGAPMLPVPWIFPSNVAAKAFPPLHICFVNMLTKVNIDGASCTKYACHEYRHVWQWNHYRDLYQWWSNHMRDGIFERYYFSKICAIEEDARIFGRTYGKKDGEALMQKYSAAIMEAAYQRGLL